VRKVPDKRVEKLTTAASVALLRDHHFGRLAFMDSVGVMPLIIPVNYLLQDDMVFFRSDAGSKLAAAIRGAPVAFEVDGVDKEHQFGWSVVVRGQADQVSDERQLAQLRQTPLLAWAPRAEPHYVRVTASMLNGRRISLSGVPADWWG